MNPDIRIKIGEKKKNKIWSAAFHMNIKMDKLKANY